MRVSPHCFNSRRAYASLVATSIPAFRRPCTPPRAPGAVPGFASPAPFSNDRTPALRQNNSAQPRPAKKARLKLLLQLAASKTKRVSPRCNSHRCHLPLRSLHPGTRHGDPRGGAQ